MQSMRMGLLDARPNSSVANSLAGAAHFTLNTTTAPKKSWTAFSLKRAYPSHRATLQLMLAVPPEGGELLV